MNHKFLIREYNERDANALAYLSTALGYPTTEEEMKMRIQNFSNDINYKTFIAETLGIIVGYIGVYKNWRWESIKPYLRIQALITHPEYRRMGIGELLISQAEEYGRGIGAEYLALNCGNREERSAAHQFYPRMGFVVESTYYKKKII